MAIPQFNPRVWGDEDEDEMPLSKGEQRKTRIAELLSAAVAMLPCRRQGDPARLRQIEAELTLLMEAELIRLQQRTGRAS